MKLTKEDKKTLQKYGHPESELPQLQEAANIAKYELYGENEKPKRIGSRKAVELLGREVWLSGISRAAFHRTSARGTIDKKHEILFDCSSMFR